jgi:hypothetical protein
MRPSGAVGNDGGECGAKGEPKRKRWQSREMDRGVSPDERQWRTSLHPPAGVSPSSQDDLDAHDEVGAPWLRASADNEPLTADALRRENACTCSA